jgi:hypothetical protein
MCIANLSDFADTAASLRPTEHVTFVGILKLMRLDFHPIHPIPSIRSIRAVVVLHLFTVLIDALNQQAGDPPWP